MNANLRIVDHPLVQHKLSLMRVASTPSNVFRQLVKEVSLFLGYEVLRDLRLTTTTIETPLQKMQAPWLAGKKLVLVPILRAGQGLLDGMLELSPSARVGHIGLYRDHDTLQPIEYYLKLPEHVSERPVVLLDPMLATGNSANAAIARLKQAGAQDIRFLCLLAAPEGVQAIHEQHPDVRIFTAAVDERLNENGYIVPGLGDAGDRLYGTK
ncbi:MAG: uracil phosphoribosyltransferase [Hyphomicrobiaceae bacterium TMED74]|nr:uracil phosphoribosyltransferase [Filomicrobium sp.]RPG46954.1 MAG: uracil phosphoribosyltransferase [Hyphomicrobiaceae bacterium TMED74]